MGRAYNSANALTAYATLVLIGYGIGAPLNGYTAWVIVRGNFDPVVHSFANSTYDLHCHGHLGVIILLAKGGFLPSTASCSAIGSTTSPLRVRSLTYWKRQPMRIA